MDCKCKITCVKVWMCLAVCGCITTLILAGIVLSSYSFETVIGPLPCKLHNIQVSNCCYDNDCIYGKQYTYYFSSNSTHCMNKYDIHNHPTNKTVNFRDKTSCYPSLKSLINSSPNWNINDSIIFYVNRECTEWTESSLHHSQIRRNLIWISIILTFVGCSCISMICGFITMYHTEILICLIDYCSCHFCDKYIDDDDDIPNYNHTTQHDIQNGSHSTSSNHNNNKVIKYNKYNKISVNNHIIKQPSPINIFNGNTSHLSVEYATQKHQLYSKTVSHDENYNNKNRHIRTRGNSNASKISKLSPLSDDANDDNIIRQFVVDDGMNPNNKIKIRETQLKDRIYTNNNNNIIYTPPHKSSINDSDMDEYNHHVEIENKSNSNIDRYINGNDMNDKHINDIIDDIASNGFSATVEFEDEWYDENGSKYTGVSTNDTNNNNIMIRRNHKRTNNSCTNDGYQDEEEEQYQINDEHHYQD